MNKSGLLTLHRRVALCFAPLLLLQALTGAALLFGGLLSRAIDPYGMVAFGRGSVASVPSLVNSAMEQFPSYRPKRLFAPETPDDTVMVEMVNAGGTSRFVSLDPVSAKVRAAGSIWRFPLQAALRLHYRLLNGTAGFCVVLANGIALTLLTASGFVFWWPGPGRVLKSLKIPNAAPARLRLGLWHRSVGLTASLIVLFSAASGVLLVTPDLVASIPSAGASLAQLLANSPGSIHEALALAKTEFPGARLHDVRFPSADQIDVSFFAPERNPSALHTVSVALSHVVVRKCVSAERNDVLWMKILPLHSGKSFGTAGQLLLLCEALALVFLAVSGPLAWWRSRRRKLATK